MTLFAIYHTYGSFVLDLHPDWKISNYQISRKNEIIKYYSIRKEIWGNLPIWPWRWGNLEGYFEKKNDLQWGMSWVRKKFGYGVRTTCTENFISFMHYPWKRQSLQEEHQGYFICSMDNTRRTRNYFLDNMEFCHFYIISEWSATDCRRCL